MAISFQKSVWYWARSCFGQPPAQWTNMRERANRFIEEALELCQAVGMSAQDAHQIVDYVYNRSVGEPWQEVGGTMVTLAVLCEVAGIDMAIAGEVELDRVWDKIEVIRQKQAAKRADSALPQG